MKMQTMLAAIKSGTAPKFQWDFSSASLDCEQHSKADQLIDCFVTPCAVLSVGDNSIELCRTYLANLSLVENRLAGMTFLFAGNCPWFALDEDDDNFDHDDFDELMAHIADFHESMELPQYENVSEACRNEYQMEINRIMGVKA